MRIFFLLIIFSISATVYAQDNTYYLKEGLVRYYEDPCHSIGFNCVAVEFYNKGIETVLQDTSINETVYHKVLWQWRYKYQSEPEKSGKEIAFFRYTDGILYKYGPAGDSIIQDYNFSRDDSLSAFFGHLPWAENGLPDKIIYDTLSTFKDGTVHRVLWADFDSVLIPNHGYYNTVIPDAARFLDSILVTADNSWTLPTGYTHNFFTVQPFYFIDSIGVVYSALNQRNRTLVGISFPDGRLYGHKVDFISGFSDRAGSPEFTLRQNYPNPFNPFTTIEFELSQGGAVQLTVFDITGKRVAGLLDENKAAGKYSVKFDGSKLASGIYFYQLQTEGFSQIQKMLLIR